MRLPHVHFVMSVIALVVCGCQPAGRCGPLHDDDIAAITEVQETYVDRILAGDWEGVAAVFTDDVILMGYDEPLQTGRGAILEHFAIIDSVTEYTVTEFNIKGEGDLAYFQWGYTVTGFVSGSSEPISFAGKAVDIVRREPDGQWRIELECYNTDHPLGAASTET